MHETAYQTCDLFFQVYLQNIEGNADATIVEIGSQDVNGSFRELAPKNFKYIGLDFVEGKGVDVVLDDPYKLPFDDNSIDIIVSSSCFDHSELFWVSFLEIIRILKPEGLFYLNVPSNGIFHRYPVDCWRFYPDSGAALITWAKRNGYNPLLLESFTGGRKFFPTDVFNDFVAVFLKDKNYANNYPLRIIDVKEDYKNALRNDHDGFLNMNEFPQELSESLLLLREIESLKSQIISLSNQLAVIKS